MLSGGSIVALDVISELHLACHVTGGLPYYKKLVGVIVVPLLAALAITLASVAWELYCKPEGKRAANFGLARAVRLMCMLLDIVRVKFCPT